MDNVWVPTPGTNQKAPVLRPGSGNRTPGQAAVNGGNPSNVNSGSFSKVLAPGRPTRVRCAIGLGGVSPPLATIVRLGLAGVNGAV